MVLCLCGLPFNSPLPQSNHDQNITQILIEGILQNTWPVLFNTVKKKQEKSKKLSQAKKAKAMWRACPSVHGVLQARILEWIAMPSSRGPSQPKDQTHVSCIAGRFFTM